MEPNWIIDLLESALQIWTDKLSEIWSLLTQTPQSFRAKKLRELYLGLSDSEKEGLTDAARIYVMKGGKLVEEGKHEELLAKGGEYARLYQSSLLDTEGAEPPADGE